jgi:hypothetical protein
MLVFSSLPWPSKSMEVAIVLRRISPACSLSRNGIVAAIDPVSSKEPRIYVPFECVCADFSLIF